MSKPPRDHTSFGSNTYFITASTWGKRHLLQSDRMARLFIKTISDYRSQKKFLLHEFVVMPDHFHVLLAPIDIPLNVLCNSSRVGFHIVRKRNLY
ncbi:MAG TPA: transposase [Terriglobales bacterium]|nr:transposase [Terriglobales bacterium]